MVGVISGRGFEINVNNEVIGEGEVQCFCQRGDLDSRISLGQITRDDPGLDGAIWIVQEPRSSVK